MDMVCLMSFTSPGMCMKERERKSYSFTMCVIRGPSSILCHHLIHLSIRWSLVVSSVPLTTWLLQTSIYLPIDSKVSVQRQFTTIFCIKYIREKVDQVVLELKSDDLQSQSDPESLYVKLWRQVSNSSDIAIHFSIHKYTTSMVKMGLYLFLVTLECSRPHS